MNDTFNIPTYINQDKIILTPLEKNISLRIGIYSDIGSGEDGVKNVKENIKQTTNLKVTELKGTDFSTQDLSSFDILIFSGGSGSKQAETLGEKGREKIKTFVENGGGYLGICAGLYLATSGFDWALHILNAETISTVEWDRGKGFVDLELTDEGKSILGDVSGLFKCRYSSGPLLKPMNSGSLPQFTIAAYFRSEVSENGVTKDVMLNTPAAVYSIYGKGKIFGVSTHPENTPGLENFIPRVLNWLSS